jgi:hypothetical protein
MSAQARVATLEELLERVQKNRRSAGRQAVGGEVIAVGVAPSVPVEPSPPRSAEIEIELRPTPVPMPSALQEEPALELELPGEKKSRAPAPAPTEAALEVELDVARSEPEVSIDEGPALTIGEDEDVIDLGELSADSTPTAPVGTRAPELARAAPAVRAPGGPPPVPLATTAPSGPVARVVARPEPTTELTFGELLGRSLALRPR